MRLYMLRDVFAVSLRSLGPGRKELMKSVRVCEHVVFARKNLIRI
jgi:hypothetical protein